MPSTEATLMVARFLRANHYNQTLEAFIQEAGLSDDVGSLDTGEWTIEQIIQEKKQFDASLSYEKHGSDSANGWNSIAPANPVEPAIAISSNVLCVSGDSTMNRLSVTCADRSWSYMNGEPPYHGLDEIHSLNESPVLSIVQAGNFVLSTAMSGHLALRDRASGKLIDTCRHHIKYAVDVATFLEDDLWIVATAAWDSKIHFYAPDRNRISPASELPTTGVIGEPVYTQVLPSNPESILFVRNPDTHSIYLVASRRDSTHLYYYKIERVDSTFRITEAGRQNLAPRSNAWVAFTPCSLAPCPGDSTLIAVATSHLPHMKLILVRLLFPSDAELHSFSQQLDQASFARAELARQDREDTAIKLHVSTMAPQTPYSTPQVVWRPDASGLFVNGDDGVIRGIEAATGKVMVTLRGHDPGSKIRTLWAGRTKPSSHHEEQEILLSGGFDKKLLIWTS